MKIYHSDLKGVKHLTFDSHRDERGEFYESFNGNDFRAAGLENIWLQDNNSVSKRNVLRGLHYQERSPQTKLVRCIEGEIYDVVLNINPDSIDYGKWRSFILSDPHEALYIGPDYAHGFFVKSEYAVVNYKVNAYRDANDERGIFWADESLNIAWPLTVQPIVSEKDMRWPMFQS